MNSKSLPVLSVALTLVLFALACAGCSSHLPDDHAAPALRASHAHDEEHGATATHSTDVHAHPSDGPSDGHNHEHAQPDGNPAHPREPHEDHDDGKDAATRSGEHGIVSRDDTPLGLVTSSASRDTPLPTSLPVQLSLQRARIDGVLDFPSNANQRVDEAATLTPQPRGPTSSFVATIASHLGRHGALVAVASVMHTVCVFAVGEALGELLDGMFSDNGQILIPTSRPSRLSRDAFDRSASPRTAPPFTAQYPTSRTLAVDQAPRTDQRLAGPSMSMDNGLSTNALQRLALLAQPTSPGSNTVETQRAVVEPDNTTACRSYLVPAVFGPPTSDSLNARSPCINGAATRRANLCTKCFCATARLPLNGEGLRLALVRHAKHQHPVTDDDRMLQHATDMVLDRLTTRSPSDRRFTRDLLFPETNIQRTIALPMVRRAQRVPTQNNSIASVTLLRRARDCS